MLTVLNQYKTKVVEVTAQWQCSVGSISLSQVTPQSLVYKLGYLFAYDPYDRKWDDLKKNMTNVYLALRLKLRLLVTTLLMTEVTIVLVCKRQIFLLVTFPMDFQHENPTSW